MEPGESTVEACAREVVEETGLQVRVGRLIGIYASPHRIAIYEDGNRFHSVVLNFEAVPIGGELGLSDETTEVGYFSLEELKFMSMPEHQVDRIDDAFAGTEAAFVR